MAYPQEQVDGLKLYCERVAALAEGGITYLFLEALRLPQGCEPGMCNGLLCPVPRDGYPSRLYFSVHVKSPYTRNWNGSARIGEQNWLAFSWKVEPSPPTLAGILLAHLAGFTKE